MVENNVKILGDMNYSGFKEILNPDALRFLSYLHINFEKRRQGLLEARKVRQIEIDQGHLPCFKSETKYIREDKWKVDLIPNDLQDRRVEITGPVDRKMVINALNSGAKCYMADFEDSTAPTWFNQVDGQINLRDAVKKTISYYNPKSKKDYKLNSTIATLLVRPRGWHLDEAHVQINGEIISGSIFDFGLYFFHNVHQLLLNKTGPYFYLPKLENHLEARLWNDIFVASQNYMNIPIGTIKATVLIETILAVYEMDEILYELRNHSSGLNCGRWDYIFSYIKKLKNHSKYVLPDRSEITMTVPFMANYVKLLIHTCHKRGAHAMGGMAAQIPVKNDTKLNELLMQKVYDDKVREVQAGHDGTWVAHPALVSIAMKVFDTHMSTPNQINKPLENINFINESDLITSPKGRITKDGVHENIDVSLMYTEAWLRGMGCIPLHNKMEDAATAEISRSQVWQYIKHHCTTTDGTNIAITKEYVKKKLNEIIQEKRKLSLNKDDKFILAGDILEKILCGDAFIEFLTLPCYPHITKLGATSRL